MTMESERAVAQLQGGAAAGTRKVAVIDFDSETYRTRNPKVAQAIRRAALEAEPAQNVAKEKKMAWHTEEAQEARAIEALNRTAVDVLLAEVLCVAFRASAAALAAPGAICAATSDRADGESTGALAAPGAICAPELVRESDESFGALEEETDGEVVVLAEWDDLELSPSEGERALLADLAEIWDALAGPDTVWCGHNIVGFDLPVLLNRWRRWGIRPPEHFPKFYGKGRWGGRVWDTMLRTPCKNPLGFVGIDDVLEAYEIPYAPYLWNGTPMDGSRVAAAYEAEEFVVIGEYCAADVRPLAELRNAQTHGGTWGGYDVRTAVAEQVRNIRASDMDEAGKAIALMNLMEMNGLIPS